MKAPQYALAISLGVFVLSLGSSTTHAQDDYYVRFQKSLRTVASIHPKSVSRKSDIRRQNPGKLTVLRAS